MHYTPRDDASTLSVVTPPQPAFYLRDIAPPEPTRSRKGLILAAVLFVLVVGIGAAVFMARPEPTRHIANTSGQAVAKCRIKVSEQLKAPGSAKFGDLTYTPESEIAGRVTGWVDAENGFGAQLRYRFACTAYNPSGSWFIQDVTFSDW